VSEKKSYITGWWSRLPACLAGNTYTSNGAAEMIKEIIANLRMVGFKCKFANSS
jgi:hypothetical protein